ncbi:hypothetical protein D3C84_564790 [compost metagenome]
MSCQQVALLRILAFTGVAPQLSIGEPGRCGKPGKQHQQRNQRQPWHHRQKQRNQCHHDQGLGISRHLSSQLGPQAGIGRGPGDDDPGSHRDNQRRNLRHNAVANRQQRVVMQRIAPALALLQNADRQTTDDVDRDDHNAGNRVAFDELGCSIHGTVEIRFTLQLAASALGFFLVDDAHVQISVDAHLFTRQGVQGETGSHLGHALGTAGDHHILHNHQDQEDHKADHVVATHDMGAHCSDDQSCIPIGQDQPRRGDIQRQTKQRGHQQQRGKGRKAQRLIDVEGHQQHHQCDGKVGQQQQIQQPGWNRREQHQQNSDDRHGQQQIAALGNHTGQEWLHEASTLLPGNAITQR